MSLRLALVLGAIAACSAPAGPVHLPPPATSTTLGPGDVFDVTVAGEKELPREYRVLPDGTIVFPYVGEIRVSGLEPQEVGRLIARRLVEKRILVEPQVTLVVKQYGSKKVVLLGSVQKPGAASWTDGMGLIEAISLVGGFNSVADAHHVRLTRIVTHDARVTAVVDVDAIAEGHAPDLPLQAGDTVMVDQRILP
jgi:polysaccharide export outer membrane protein